MKPEYKLFWFYLLAKCNHAGLWLNPDLELAEFQLGVKLDKKTIMQQFGSDIEIINEKHLYLKKFVHFQYGELNPNVKAHLSVIKLLDKYNIAHSKELGKSLTTVKDKYKDNTKIKTIDQREQEFFKQVQKVADKDMSSEVLDDFCNYWTEKNIGGTKMRYEKENTFDISRRLIRWSKMSKEWNKDKETASGHKLNDFKFDTTGNARIGYCSKCNKSDFYDKWNIVTQDSTCCKVEVKPTK
tara:strand:+ start:5145 stop:5867 length:723 start_codon:yes stop_codon:yes gene_type:complete